MFMNEAALRLCETSADEELQLMLQLRCLCINHTDVKNNGPCPGTLMTSTWAESGRRLVERFVELRNRN